MDLKLPNSWLKYMAGNPSKSLQCPAIGAPISDKSQSFDKGLICIGFSLSLECENECECNILEHRRQAGRDFIRVVLLVTTVK